MMRRALGDFAVLHYAAAILVGSFLLFQVQPMIARFILPWFGGSPAVWTTCLLFFQVALLAGYAYAHSLADRVELRRQDRKSTRLNSSHLVISYAVFCLKKKKS